jgi:hypothetical protein
MGASVFKVNANGGGAMTDRATVPAGGCYRLMSVGLVFQVAPTTSENFTVTLDSQIGPTWDLLLYAVDPAAHAMTDLVWLPDQELFLEGGDARPQDAVVDLLGQRAVALADQRGHADARPDDVVDEVAVYIRVALELKYRFVRQLQ